MYKDYGFENVMENKEMSCKGKRDTAVERRSVVVPYDGQWGQAVEL